MAKATKKPAAKKAVKPAPAKKLVKAAMAATPVRAPVERYTQEAVELARSLYHKYGGRNHAAIEKEMRAAGYPGWSRSRLLNKGKDPKNPNWREGWISKFGFDATLELHQRITASAVLNDSQELYLQIQTARKAAGLIVVGGKAGKDEHYIYRDYVKLELAAKAQLDLGRASFETTAEAWVKIQEWLRELVADQKFPAKALKDLVGASDHLLERARETYGESEGTEQPVDG